MRKYIFTLIFFSVCVLTMNAQTDAAFTSVPVVNGKVVFEQFIHTDQGLSADQKYALLFKWGKDKYTGSPLLSGIRFDDKARTMTVSSKAELLLPANKAGVREKMMMNYRFDTSITSAGCMVIIRDITYQNDQAKGSSVFPKAYTAEQMITDQAVNAGGEDAELKSNTRRATLTFLNGLFAEIDGLFRLNK